MHARLPKAEFSTLGHLRHPRCRLLLLRLCIEAGGRLDVPGRRLRSLVHSLGVESVHDAVFTEQHLVSRSVDLIDSTIFRVCTTNLEALLFGLSQLKVTRLLRLLGALMKSRAAKVLMLVHFREACGRFQLGMVQFSHVF